jgi:hypothetical protein
LLWANAAKFKAAKRINKRAIFVTDNLTSAARQFSCETLSFASARIVPAVAFSDKVRTNIVR